MWGTYTLLLALVGNAYADWSVPMIFSHHKYLENNPFYDLDMKMSNLTSPIQVPMSAKDALTATESILSQCLSDAFVIIQVPGLELADLQEWPSWHSSRMIMSKASTIVSLAHMTESESFDLKLLEKTLRANCGVSKIEIDSMDEPHNAKYEDSKPRLLDVKIPEDLLYEKPGSEQRAEQLLKIDELVYDIVKKLPSPNIFIMIISDTPEEYDEEELKKDLYIGFDELPEDPRQILPGFKERAKKSKRWIWPDITIFDRSRWFGFERNEAKERKIENKEDDDTWLEYKKKEIIFQGNNRFDTIEKENQGDKPLPNLVFLGVDTGLKIDKQLIVDNSLLILLSACLIFLIIFVDLVKSTIGCIFSFFKSPKREEEVKKDSKGESKKTK